MTCNCILNAHCDPGRPGCRLRAGATLNEGGGVCGPHRVYCASEKAIEAAAAAYLGNDPSLLADALIAAHHPSLGLDRSVCLSDVAAWLDENYGTPDADRFLAEFDDRKAA